MKTKSHTIKYISDIIALSSSTFPSLLSVPLSSDSDSITIYVYIGKSKLYSFGRKAENAFGITFQCHNCKV